MKFFKPEDTQSIGGTTGMYIYIGDANAKLEREGRVVYGPNYVDKTVWTHEKNLLGNQFINTCQALVINIEPIEKCEHPKEKILHIGYAGDYWVCQCGAKVNPTAFEEIK